MRPVESQASLWDQLVPRGVRQVNSGECVGTVDSQLSLATSWFAGESARPVGSQVPVCVCVTRWLP